MDNFTIFLEYLSKITKSAYFGLATFVLAIFSIILAYIFFKKGKNIYTYHMTLIATP